MKDEARQNHHLRDQVVNMNETRRFSSRTVNGTERARSHQPSEVRLIRVIWEPQVGSCQQPNSLSELPHVLPARIQGVRLRCMSAALKAINDVPGILVL